jgi:hypothetical protein
MCDLQLRMVHKKEAKEAKEAGGSGDGDKGMRVELQYRDAETCCVGLMLFEGGTGDASRETRVGKSPTDKSLTEKTSTATSTASNSTSSSTTADVTTTTTTADVTTTTTTTTTTTAAAAAAAAAAASDYHAKQRQQHLLRMAIHASPSETACRVSVSGDVKQLVRGEEGFYYPSEEVSHTFALHSIYESPRSQRIHRQVGHEILKMDPQYNPLQLFIPTHPIPSLHP